MSAVVCSLRLDGRPTDGADDGFRSFAFILVAFFCDSFHDTVSNSDQGYTNPGRHVAVASNFFSGGA